MTTRRKRSTKHTYTCAKCGRTTETTKKLRRCHRMEVVPPGQFRKPEYMCWGTLTRTATTKKAEPAASAKLAHAEKAVARHLTALTRTTTLIRMWQRRVEYYRKQVDAATIDARIKALSAITDRRGARAITLED